jgi:Na+/pantothenate symporter
VSAILSVPNPLAEPDYVPTIVNGLVTATSILMAFAFFSVAQSNPKIRDKTLKIKYNLHASLYLLLLFLIILLGFITGFRLVLENELRNAFICFVTVFILTFGIVMDLSGESPI